MKVEKDPKINKSTPNIFSADLKKKVEEAAYQKWIQRGAPPDSAEKDWLEAEEEVFDSLKEP